MFTTGSEITTAVTDIINAVVATFLTYKIFKRGMDEKRNVLWGIAFTLFVLVSITGFCIHGLTIFSPHDINQLLRMVLNVETAYMLTFYLVSVLLDVYGEARLRGGMTVLLVIATLFCVVTIALSLVGLNGFVVFLIYCVPVLLFLLVALIRHQHDKKGMYLHLIAVVLLIVANVVDLMEFIRFEICGWEFDCNSLYHVILLAFILVQYQAICRVGNET